jgi:hypothetical protein
MSHSSLMNGNISMDQRVPSNDLDGEVSLREF